MGYGNITSGYCQYSPGFNGQSVFDFGSNGWLSNLTTIQQLSDRYIYTKNCTADVAPEDMCLIVDMANGRTVIGTGYIVLVTDLTGIIYIERFDI